ncbi:hypothetical protein EVAR_66365_1 [Eumeta japonica]|uniref:Uncharacterized protein n=1 Tax=Eumeta variegata TaxID=151549 RepID=A0A4C1ZGH9_EUMVA|nr:hypothetical protein EVAR_66365_1 [Eumeta japonica]
MRQIKARLREDHAGNHGPDLGLGFDSNQSSVLDFGASLDLNPDSNQVPENVRRRATEAVLGSSRNRHGELSQPRRLPLNTRSDSLTWKLHVKPTALCPDKAPPGFLIAIAVQAAIRVAIRSSS